MKLWYFGDLALSKIIKISKKCVPVKTFFSDDIILYYYYLTNNLIINYLSLMIRGDSDEFKRNASSQIMISRSSKEIQDGSTSRRDHLF